MGRDRNEVVALLQGEALPATRVGEALRAARRAHGWKRKQVAAMLHIKPERLKAYERARLPIPPDVGAQLIECYGEELAGQLPERGPLPVDTTHADAEPDAFLASYVEIVKKLRKAKPGKPVPLRAHDLAILSVALERDADTIEHQLVELLGCSRKQARAIHRNLLRHRVVLPVAGLAATVVALSGAHAALASSGPSTPPKPPVEASVNHRFSTFTDAPTTTTTTVARPVVTTPPTTAAPAPVPPPAPAPVPQAPAEVVVTPPSIPPDDTPVGVLPGEHPIKVDQP